MYLRHPISNDSNVLIYARFSTEEQRQQSITDQAAFCQEFLVETNCQTSSIDVLRDEGVSGELRSRPGIDQVRNGIRQGRWDLILCEDSSRLFRGTSACLDLVGHAVDNDIRVICINDRVDTAEEDWQHRLEGAQHHHGQDNHYTRFRIRRAHDGLWRSGAAIGLLRSGYIRESENPDNHRSPKRDRIDPRWAPTIQEAFRRVASGEPLDRVASFLTEAGLPKTANSQTPDWTKGNVISLVRCPQYRGVQSYRETISRRRYSTGGSITVRNPESENVLMREMPHLRIVEDWLWHQANEVIDTRARPSNVPTGADHPLYRIPRDSRSPLSNVFVCGVCGNKMHMTGRNEGGYRCGVAKRGDCWNRTTALRALTHQRIAAAVSDAILEALPGAVDALLEHVEQILQSRGDWSKLQRDLRIRRTKHERAQHNLLQAIEDSDVIPQFVNERIVELAAEGRKLQLEEERLKSHRSLSVELPSRETLRHQLRSVAEETADLTRETGSLLQQLLNGPIRAIPCQQLGSNKVVLRAKLTVQLVHILPSDIRLLLEGSGQLPNDLVTTRRELVLDLFDPSNAPRYAVEALAFYDCDFDHRPTLEQVGEHLGISKRSAHLALTMGRELRAAGLTDPFVELSEAPEKASRWRPRRCA